MPGTDIELEVLAMEAEFVRLQRYADGTFLVQAKQDTDSYLDKNGFQRLQGERKAVKKDLLQLGVRSAVHVAEVFSNPGKTCSVHRLGLRPGLALELQTAWDLNDPVQRAKRWSHLQRERPIVIVGSWEWTWYQDDTHEVDD